jgi:hypothetical protein
MTHPFGTTPAPRRGALPEPPTGWPVGSYPTYEKAQHAVDYLAEQNFPVADVTIVGVDLMQVERVLGKLTWPKVIWGGIISGAWLGLFFGLLLGLFTVNFLGPLLVGLVGGIIFGLISVTIPYAASKGTRDFASSMQLVAGRYDVLCKPQTAEGARDMLARLAL